MRSLLRSSLLTTSLVIAGCAAQTDSVGDETIDQSSEALSSLGRSLVGDLHYAAGENFYERLSLASNGKYTASWKPCPVTAKCATRLESGRWKARSPNMLTLDPSSAAPKIFTLSIAGDGSGFKITAKGKTERLDRDVPPAQTGESCGFRVQTIACASGLECRWTQGPLDALNCARPLSQAGQFCGGIAAFQCAPGLACELSGAYPDAGGTCISCPIPSCAPPPNGCNYEPVRVPSGTCPTGCGTLVCSGGT